MSLGVFFATRQNVSQAKSLQSHPMAFLKYTKFVDRLIFRLLNCEMCGWVGLSCIVWPRDQTSLVHSELDIPILPFFLALAIAMHNHHILARAFLPPSHRFLEFGYYVQLLRLILLLFLPFLLLPLSQVFPLLLHLFCRHVYFNFEEFSLTPGQVLEKVVT